MFTLSRIRGSGDGQGGFTLIETMVTVAIAAVLVTVAVPNYQLWSANQQLKDSITELKGDLEIIRIMAMKTGVPAAVQVDVPEPGRYLVFLENDVDITKRNNGKWDNGEDLLGQGGQQIPASTITPEVQQMHSRALAAGLSFGGVVRAIGFGPSGRRSFPVGGAPAALTVNQEVYGTSTPKTKAIEVIATGGVRVQK